MSNKIIRSICIFADTPNEESINKLHTLANTFRQKGFTVQTTRLCSSNQKAIYDLDASGDGSLMLSVGELSYEDAMNNLEKILNARNISFNVNLSDVDIQTKHADLLTEIINKKPSKTFNFTYTFNNSHSSPYFPSAAYSVNGFAIGFQSTDLSKDCTSLEDWLQKMTSVWNEVNEIVGTDPDFLGIDTSVAPLFEGESSFLNFINRLEIDFKKSSTTDFYLKITNHIKNSYNKTVGLCGMMLPCLEDFELATLYEQGDFSIERNVFLSLHSGLGIDTYPIGVDETPERIVEILRLVQGLSNKYKKPLSVRFVSDGKAKIGENTDFHNQYLKDVAVRTL